MSHDRIPHSPPAPCIVDTGIVVNKDDMRRLLNSLSRVYYIHSLDGSVHNQGEGCILEVFADPAQSTLIANGALYLNVQSFDYLHLYLLEDGESCFELVQDNRRLQLLPQSNCLADPQMETDFDVDSLEAMVAQVLSAKWDVQFDDEDCAF
ncbi:hypothetical protein [Oscillatoria sp. FACHB-1406]|uniref:hypothetical protein n=1 Tax=Oscillatoria sp. FACHB-1406 TaxID=2692846 RepID=UPI001688E2A0|nr:hypothetical protein [Oscillatoria sp. FACHB-1406]MBD2579584.1 hypothetical protein [Oscillatoria sp. FACHB-1406]